MAEIVIVAGLLIFGLFCGSYLEQKHYRSIREREEKFKSLPAFTTRKCDQLQVDDCKLVAGCTAISIDYFKNFSGVLRNIFGGRVAAYETLIDRARREAVLRMKEQAIGYDIIMNMRIETSSIGGEKKGKQGVVSIEALAYGTALKLGTLNKPQ